MPFKFNPFTGNLDYYQSYIGSGALPHNVFTVGTSNADYTSIQACLTANPTEGIVVLVGPMFNTSDTINFTASFQSVVGIGSEGTTSKPQISRSNATISYIDHFGGCSIENMKLTVTNCMTTPKYVISGIGTLSLINCDLYITNFNVSGAARPETINAYGYSPSDCNFSLTNCTIQHYDWVDDSTGTTGIKCAMETRYANIKMRNCVVTYSTRKRSKNSSFIYGNGDSTVDIENCTFTITDEATLYPTTPGSTNFSGVYFGVGTSTINISRNDITVSQIGGTTNAQGFGSTGANTITSMTNNLSVVAAGGSAYSFNMASGSTLYSVADKIIAANGHAGTGTFNITSSEASGNWTVSNDLTIGDASFLGDYKTYQIIAPGLGNMFATINNVSGESNIFGIGTKDGDGTDGCFVFQASIWEPTFTNFQALIYGYIPDLFGSNVFGIIEWSQGAVTPLPFGIWLMGAPGVHMVCYPDTGLTEFNAGDVDITAGSLTASGSGSFNSVISSLYGTTYQSDIISLSATTAFIQIQDVAYTAKAYGPDGNLLSITYTTGGTAGSEVVSLLGYAITIQIESGVSTQLQIATAINNSVLSAIYVTAAAVGAPTGQTAPVSQTFLAGGHGFITIKDTIVVDFLHATYANANSYELVGAIQNYLFNTSDMYLTINGTEPATSSQLIVHANDNDATDAVSLGVYPKFDLSTPISEGCGLFYVPGPTPEYILTPTATGAGLYYLLHIASAVKFDAQLGTTEFYGGNVTISTAKDLTISTGRLGIGIAAGTPYTIRGSAQIPDQIIKIANTGLWICDTSDTTTEYGTLRFFKNADTGSGALSDTHIIGGITGYAHDGTDYNKTAGIHFVIDGTVETDTCPTRISFRTTTTNNTTEKVYISPNGNTTFNNYVGIGAAAGTTYTVATGAKTPDLLLVSTINDPITGIFLAKDNATAARSAGLYIFRSHSGGACQSGDYTFKIFGMAHDSIDYVSGAGIASICTATATSNVAPQKLSLCYGSGASSTEGAYLYSDGGFTMLGKCGVNGFVAGTGITIEGTVRAPDLGINMTDLNFDGVHIYSNSTTAAVGACILGVRAHGAGVAVASGDALLKLFAAGHDGTQQIITAGISARVLGTVSTNTVPTELVFFTAPAAAEAIRMQIAPDGTVNIGDWTGAVNYSTFEPDGTLRFNGAATVWNDIFCQLHAKTTGAGNPALTTFSGNTKLYVFAVNDIIDLGGSELLHGWKEGTPITLHVHYVTNGLNDTTVRGVKWEIDYTWANPEPEGGTIIFGAATTVSAEGVIAANEADKTHKFLDIVTFTPTGGKVGAQVILSLKRIASVTNVGPINDPFVIAVGIHYELDTVGSRTISGK